MMDKPAPQLKTYFQEADTWHRDREALQARWLRRSWILTTIASLIAVFEAVAIVSLTPLKTVVPYTLLVDRQTGYIQALKPLDANVIAPDAALTRSFLAQYVIARTEFDLDSVREDYRKVGLWSAGEAKDSYVAMMRVSNPASPLASLPHGAHIDVQILGISSLNADTALVRFSSTRTDAGGASLPPQPWSAVVRYRFTTATMSAADRLVNPLGFQVIRYRQNADFVPLQPRTAVVNGITSAAPNASPIAVGAATHEAAK